MISAQQIQQKMDEFLGFSPSTKIFIPDDPSVIFKKLLSLFRPYKYTWKNLQTLQKTFENRENDPARFLSAFYSCLKTAWLELFGGEKLTGSFNFPVLSLDYEVRGLFMTLKNSVEFTGMIEKRRKQLVKDLRGETPENVVPHHAIDLIQYLYLVLDYYYTSKIKEDEWLEGNRNGDG